MVKTDFNIDKEEIVSGLKIETDDEKLKTFGETEEVEFNISGVDNKFGNLGELDSGSEDTTESFVDKNTLFMLGE
jgi:hypothetical protein